MKQTAVEWLYKKLLKEFNFSIIGKLCSNCKKQMVAGAYPKWFCLRENCDKYLKEQN
jgi:hypothetical protein